MTVPLSPAERARHSWDGWDANEVERELAPLTATRKPDPEVKP